MPTKFCGNPSRFKNIIIHPGDFHFMKENFKVIGCFVTNSGFEDVVLQASVCSSGSLIGVLKGSHYNRGWTVHNNVSEALERLLLKRFLQDIEPTVIDELRTAATSDQPNDTFSFKLMSARYQAFKQSVRRGDLGKQLGFGSCI